MREVEQEAGVAAGRVAMVDARTQPEGSRNPDEQKVVPLRVIFAGVWLGIKIAVPLLIGAVVLATIFFDLTTALIAAGAAFALMLFISIPLWLATIEDELVDPEH